jgi:hypothetical protein
MHWAKMFTLHVCQMPDNGSLFIPDAATAIGQHEIAAPPAR